MVLVAQASNPIFKLFCDLFIQVYNLLHHGRSNSVCADVIPMISNVLRHLSHFLDQGLKFKPFPCYAFGAIHNIGAECLSTKGWDDP
jgi:hypothetical protein